MRIAIFLGAMIVLLALTACETRMPVACKQGHFQVDQVREFQHPNGTASECI